MIIEFTGVPCSGKSDISHELAQTLRWEGFSVCEKQYDLSHSRNSKKRIIKKVAGCLLYCLKHPKSTLNYYRKIGSLRLFINYVWLLSHNCKNDICILEQGYLQLVGSFFDNVEPNTEKMAFLIKELIPHTAIVQVFVWVSKETAMNRAMSREDKPFFMQSEASDVVLDYAYTTVEQLEKLWCLSYGEAKVISVSNEKNDSQFDVSKTIFDILKQKELL